MPWPLWLSPPEPWQLLSSLHTAFAVSIAALPLAWITVLQRPRLLLGQIFSEGLGGIEAYHDTE